MGISAHFWCFSEFHWLKQPQPNHWSCLTSHCWIFTSNFYAWERTSQISTLRTLQRLSSIIMSSLASKRCFRQRGWFELVLSAWMPYIIWTFKMFSCLDQLVLRLSLNLVTISLFIQLNVRHSPRTCLFAVACVALDPTFSMGDSGPNRSLQSTSRSWQNVKMVDMLRPFFASYILIIY